MIRFSGGLDGLESCLLDLVDFVGCSGIASLGAIVYITRILWV